MVGGIGIAIVIASGNATATGVDVLPGQER
jgi:hypothetical protein